MTCARCRKKIADEAARCPYCGEANRIGSGVIQTSIVLISAGGSDRIYRTVEEVPARLRNKLLRSTNGANSATILIADRRGRKEVAKAMRTLPGPTRRRLIRSALNSGASSAARWLTPRRKRAVLAVMTLLVLLIIGLVFSVRPLSGVHLSCMVAATAIPVEQYLHTSYEPDMEYVNGQLVERNVGEYFHSLLQSLVAGELLNRSARGFRAFTALRVRISAEPRYRRHLRESLAAQSRPDP